MDLKEEGVLGSDPDKHWYYRSKMKMVLVLLGRRRFERIVDVGAGSGIFSRMLLDAGVAKQAICVDPAYTSDSSESSVVGRISFVRRLSETASSDLMLFMDVLEHVEDPRALLRSYLPMVKQGGAVVITVPAFQSLWSPHDVFLEHRCRYRLSEIEEVTRDAGLEVICGRYFFGFLFPIAAGMRIMQSISKGMKRPPRSALRPASPFANFILGKVHDVECGTLLSVNRLAGVTAVCIATRR